MILQENGNVFVIIGRIIVLQYCNLFFMSGSKQIYNHFYFYAKVHSNNYTAH